MKCTPRLSPSACGQRVDQIVDQRRARASHFAILAAHRIDLPRMISEHRRDFVGVKSRGVDRRSALRWFRAATSFPSPMRNPTRIVASFGFERNHLCVVHDVRALIDRHTRISVDELFRGNDSGGWNNQSGAAFDVRFALADLRGINNLQAFDAIVFSAFLQSDEFLFFVCIGGNDEFPGVAKSHLVLRAEIVGEAVAFDAKARFQRILRIVNARMIDAAVARAGRHAEFRKLLDEKDVLPAPETAWAMAQPTTPPPIIKNIGLVHSFCSYCSPLSSAY